MNSRHLPLLNDLRYFEAAARHLSFKRAAEELCVTNAAVSLRIKQLEAHLGLSLFTRQNNRLALSAAGEQYMPRIREALRSIEQATQLLFEARRSVLRVAAPSLLASKWLVPRLYRFVEQQTDVRVELTPSDAADATTDRGPLWLSDRQSPGAGGVAEPLLLTTIVAVCSPATKQRLPSDGSLHGMMLIHDASPRRAAHHPDWRQWLAETGVDADPERGLHLADPAMALQAAIDDQGIALAPDELVSYDLAAGRLVRAVDQLSALSLTFYLMLESREPVDPHVLAFATWLRKEALLTAAGQRAATLRPPPVPRG